MLTIDDVNTLLEKYNSTGFWYDLDFNKIDLTSGKVTDYDFIKDIHYDNPVWINLDIQNEFFGLMVYAVDSEGNFLPNAASLVIDSNTGLYKASIPEDNDCIFKLYIDPSCVYEGDFVFNMSDGGFLPVSPTQIPVVNGEFDNKFYVQQIGSGVTQYFIDGEPVTLQTDSKGTYLILPEAQDCILGCTLFYEDFNFYRITFREFKSIPQLSVSTLYRGTPQTIQLINNDTEEPITEFQAYYQGRKLKDNIIELPYDAPDVVDITVDLLDPEYPESTVKLKANTEIKLCTSIAQITNAIEQGIQTLQVRTPSGSTQLLVDELTFNNVTFINSKILFEKCILNNVTITQTEGYNEGTVILSQGTVLNDCTLQNLRKLIVDAIEFNNCTLKKINSVENYILHQPGVIQITGTITDCNFNRSIVFSDGGITLLNNTFNRISSKQHFPNFLYLTGDYTVKNNVFTLKGEWEELAFNMCIIKANNDFNPSVFINDNLFDLNIVYEDEPTNTFYYCLVDDDKIRAVRLQ